MIRILLARFGEGYGTELWQTARNIRDAGSEAIYTETTMPEVIVHSAIQESVDWIAVAAAPGADLDLFRRLFEVLRKEKAEDILVSAAGDLSEEDRSRLAAMGVRSFFPLHGAHDDVVRWIREHIQGEPPSS
jgi:methylmalonyl-CoA mutase cobalamin-binding domain/chain